MPDLFNPTPGPADALVYVLGGLFAVEGVVGLFVRLRRGSLFAGDPALARVAGTAGTVGLVVGLVGVLFALAAYFAVPVLAARFWLVGLMVVGLGLLAFLGYHLRVRLPGIAERERELELRRRYQPRPGGKRGGKKGKGRKK